MKISNTGKTTSYETIDHAEISADHAEISVDHAAISVYRRITYL